MAKMSYVIQRRGETWFVVCNGEDRGDYLTQEAAFETAANFASADLRTGNDIVLAATSPTNPGGATERGGRPKSGDGFS